MAGGLKNFFFKINTSIGNVEKTKMSQEFNDSVERYNTYSTLLDPLVSKLEGALQQNPEVLSTSCIESPKGENPHELLAASLEIFKTYQRDENLVKIDAFIEKRKKLAKTHRKGQVGGRHAIKALRRFFSFEYKDVCTENDKLTQARDYMDMIKHDVKTAKNTVQIENSATLYEEAVRIFNDQAKQVIQLLDALPKVQQTHTDGIAEYFDCLQKNNAEMLHIIKS
ncbi:hypothetical protein QR680_017022 [Steinernema hermaphroditum]|uniref:BAR domain-containing protein n=1 Tax=Steinernema hermaphroditum TaxID=289476 RepID=A0AA39HE69_9BILA|nr:hypothetical protein QR680_017022 [Steinernema hermaphroditum]